MLSRVAFSLEQSEPESWAWLSQAHLSGLGGPTKQGRGQPVPKVRGESLWDLYSHWSDTERGGRAQLPDS